MACKRGGESNDDFNNPSDKNTSTKGNPRCEWHFKEKKHGTKFDRKLDGRMAIIRPSTV
jgi:hypothetical protein